MERRAVSFYAPTPHLLHEWCELAFNLTIWNSTDTDLTPFLPLCAKTIVVDGTTFDFATIMPEAKKCGYDVILKNTFLPSRDATMATIIAEEAYELKFPDSACGKYLHCHSCCGHLQLKLIIHYCSTRTYSTSCYLYSPETNRPNAR